MKNDKVCDYIAELGEYLIANLKDLIDKQDLQKVVRVVGHPLGHLSLSPIVKTQRL